jgi:hypothetical protein
MPKLNHHLLCPMQCRVNYVTVNDVPKMFTIFPTDNRYAINLQKPDNESNVLSISLHLQGVTLYLPVRKPTVAEWETGDIIDWDPSDPT